MLYAADARWWGWHKEALRDFRGEKVSNSRIADKIDDPSVRILRFLSRAVWSDDPETIAGGEWHHGGYQCINLAAHYGATWIALLGYDGRPGHWHAGHPVDNAHDDFENMCRSFRLLPAELEQREITVVNCSPGTAIPHFPMMRLEDALC